MNWPELVTSTLLRIEGADVFIRATLQCAEGLDSAGHEVENTVMEIPGRVHNGVVVLDGHPLLPEGAAVSVVFPVPGLARPVVEKRRIELPLVHCEQPGSVHLTSERIGEILDAEDAASRH